MNSEPRHLATVQITLEPTLVDDGKRRVAGPDRWAVWLTIDGEMQLYGMTHSRMEAQELCREIGTVLGVSRELEV